MPIYEFICLKCHKDFEKLVMGADPHLACPECGSDKLEKQMSRCGYKVGKGAGLSFSDTSSSSCSSCSTHNCSQCH